MVLHAALLLDLKINSRYHKDERPFDFNKNIHKFKYLTPNIYCISHFLALKSETAVNAILAFTLNHLKLFTDVSQSF